MRNCRFTGRADDFTQDVGELCRRKNKRRRISHIVLRERDEMDLRPDLAVEAIEILQQKGLRQLPRAIGAKVEKQNRRRHHAPAAHLREKKSDGGMNSSGFAVLSIADPQPREGDDLQISPRPRTIASQAFWCGPSADRDPSQNTGPPP